MESTSMRVVRPANVQGTKEPNHLIIWLDKHIGKSEHCVLLKKNFFMITDPTTACERNLEHHDIDNNIRSNDNMSVRVDGIQFVLRTFHDPTTCYEAIKNNLDKRIFLITSGSKGEVIVPQLVAKFPEKFAETQAIYIFCAKMNMRETAGAGEPTNDWAFDYLDNVLMYDHQDPLLARVVLDIAEYFFAEAEKFDREGQMNDALQHYNWSRLMFERSEKIENKKNLMSNKIAQVDDRINDLEQRFKLNND